MPDFFEKQKRLLCGMHAINNILQERKCVFYPGLGEAVTPRGISGGVQPVAIATEWQDVPVRPAAFANVCLNLYATCEALTIKNPGGGHCNKDEGNTQGMFSDDLLEHALRTLGYATYLNVAWAVKGQPGDTPEYQKQREDELSAVLKDPDLLGIVVNIGDAHGVPWHWTAYVKWAGNCQASQLAYFDSLQAGLPPVCRPIDTIKTDLIPPSYGKVGLGYIAVFGRPPAPHVVPYPSVAMTSLWRATGKTLPRAPLYMQRMQTASSSGSTGSAAMPGAADNVYAWKIAMHSRLDALSRELKQNNPGLTDEKARANALDIFTAEHKLKSRPREYSTTVAELIARGYSPENAEAIAAAQGGGGNRRRVLLTRRRQGRLQRTRTARSRRRAARRTRRT